MIIEDTVLILGAGASIPYGLPSGEQLVDLLIHLLNPEPTDNEQRIKNILGAATFPASRKRDLSCRIGSA